jgi:hypothetical protein
MKILSRIKFVTMDDLLVENGGVIPRESLPSGHGSSSVDELADGMNQLKIQDEKKSDEDLSQKDTITASLIQWVDQSIKNLPLPNI